MAKPPHLIFVIYLLPLILSPYKLQALASRREHKESPFYLDWPKNSAL